MEKNKTILFIPPVNWNYYPYRDQELPAMLADKGYLCIYLNPLNYTGSEKASRFAEVNHRIIPENLTVIDRKTSLRKSVFLFLYENYQNRKAVKKFKPDVVISTSHLMAVFTCLYCRKKDIRFIFDVTDDWELVDRSIAGRLYKYLLKPLLAIFSGIVTTTSQLQFEYFNTHRKKHTYLISNGISPITFSKLNAMKAKTERTYEVNFIGSLRDWYDFDLIFNVFSLLPGITLNIYGQGPMYNELRQKAENFPNIHVPGSIDSELTPGLLKNSLFGILPLKQNKLNQSTCPVKLFDYWGASKAVISTPVKEVRNVGGNAILYASGQNEFLEKIKLLVSDVELSEKLGLEGFNKVKDIHNYDVITQKFVHLINL